jgi:hypothetical protein
MSARQTLVPGTLVVKAPQALPATATANLYVASGAVMVTGLLGRVTTATGATATNLSLGTTGSTTTSLATATAIASKAAGSWMFPTISSAAFAGLQIASGPTPFLLTSPTPGEDQLPGLIAPFLLGADTITWTTSATDTGAVEWYLWYVPIDTSATVS